MGNETADALVQQLNPGDVIDGRYVVDALIGSGGFGHVYRGRQSSTGQKVAIKVLLTARLAGGKPEVEFERFDREVKFIASLHHPNIVRLIDSGKIGVQMLYMVLEYIEGESLAQMIARNEKLSVSSTTELMLQVLDALACAHDLGIVHRDLKPANIMVMKTGVRYNAKILDFGISSIVDSARDASYQTLTSMDEVFGTAPYMAPEQVSKVAVTPQTDIYAWGLIFIEALTGKSPIPPGDLITQAHWQASAAPVPIPPEIEHRTLRKVLRKATAKPMAARYKHASDAITELRGPISMSFNQDSAPRLDSTRHHKNRADKPLKRRNFAMIWLVVASLVALTAAVWWMLLGPAPSSSPPLTPPPPPTSPPQSRCTSHSACAQTSPGTICAPSGQCLPYSSPECTLAAGTASKDNAIFIGGLAQLPHPTYQARDNAIRLAIREINDAGGPLDGRSLVYISCNDNGDPVQGLRAANHLLSLGVPAIIGPDHSSVLLSVATEATIKAGVLILSSASTSPVLTDLKDNNLIWRLVPDDRLQASAIADEIRKRQAKKVTIFTRKGTYGASLMEAISSNLGPQLSQNALTLQAVSYDDEHANFPSLAARALSQDTDLILILGSFESSLIIEACEQHRKDNGWILPHFNYLLSEAGLKPETLATIERLPHLNNAVDVMELIDSNTPNYGPFRLRYEADFGPLPTLGAKVPNAYDAAYTLTYAISSLSSFPPHTPITGTLLASRIPSLLSGPPVPVGPTSIGKARSLLSNNASINLEGVSGSLDFDPSTGQAPGTFRLQRISLSNGKASLTSPE